MSSTQGTYFAIVPRGLADLLARELMAIDATQLVERPFGVQFSGSLEVGYRACLWSRVASRVLLQLYRFDAPDADEFYAQALACDWETHVDPAGTLACEFTGSHPTIVNTHFGALRLKDAVCDRLRRVSGRRPEVALSRPAVRLSAHAQGRSVTLWLDLAGEALHRRGYRRDATIAPLRENLAAGMLLRARWPEAAARDAEFLDPMCGSGTLVIEAALIAAHRAPALLRDYFGFLGWRQHDAALWQRLRAEARCAVLPQIRSTIRGSDIDADALSHAQANAARAEVAHWVHFEQRPIASVQPMSPRAGLICTNPPYGERLGDAAEAEALYAELGRALREHFAGWDAALLSATPQTSHALRLRSYRVHKLWNGPIPCRLLRIDLGAPGAEDARARRLEPLALSSGAAMLANRLQKNRRQLERQAQRAAVSCYRLYDADMPEYAFAIDRYVEADSGAVHLQVQEYAPPRTIDPQAARRRRQEALAVLPRELQVPADRIHLRVRRRRRGGTPLRDPESASEGAGRAVRARARAYEAVGADVEAERGVSQRRFIVQEAGLRFRVDLDEHFDSGLFLDQRLTRARIRDGARGARFLNLFCYTASASVYAAAGGARSSVSVDLSPPNLRWAAENFRLNGLGTAAHHLVRADCREWLAEAAGGYLPAEQAPPFDLIFLDPPTFSNSRRMRGVLDVQRDHPALIFASVQLLSAQGLLLFSTNAQRFRLDPAVPSRCTVTDISQRTLPFDFKRNPHIHRCFEIRKQP